MRLTAPSLNKAAAGEPLPPVPRPKQLPTDQHETSKILTEPLVPGNQITEPLPALGTDRMGAPASPGET